MKRSALLLFGPMSRKNYTDLYWKIEKVSHGSFGFFLRLLWTKV